MPTATDTGDVVRQRWSIFFWLAFFLLVAFWVGMTVRMLRVTADRFGPLPLWAVCVLAMLLLLGLAGREINGRWFGMLIDSRNKMSLARLQITLWTVMVLSAYLMIAFPRINAMLNGNPRLTQEQALAITFPEELLLAMGISAVSFAGANLINSNKKGKRLQIEGRATADDLEARRDAAKRELTAAEADLAAASMAESTAKTALQVAETALQAAPADQVKKNARDQADLLHQVKEKAKKDAVDARDAKTKALAAAEADLAAAKEAEGLLHKNPSPADASWSDFFRGEEIGNYKLVDMSKVQMLFFTVVVVATYAAVLAALLLDLRTLAIAPQVSFPEFSNTMNALLGISHATYLSVKTIDKS